MTKFMLGVAVGYVFSDIIDELVSKAAKVSTNGGKAPTSPVTQP